MGCQRLQASMPSKHAGASHQATRKPASGEAKEKRREQKEVASPSEAGNGREQLVLPEDGYEWKKYGQKNRSYFRCRHKLCKVEWHPNDPGGELRIVYEGARHHGAPPPSAQGASGGASNQYELGAQYFGGPRSH